MDRRLTPTRLRHESVCLALATIKPWRTRHGTASVHRTPTGRDLRRFAARCPRGRAAGLRRLLPLGPLPAYGRWVGTARTDRRLDHAGRPGPRDDDDPPR